MRLLTFGINIMQPGPHSKMVCDHIHLAVYPQMSGDTVKVRLLFWLTCQHLGAAWMHNSNFIYGTVNSNQYRHPVQYFISFWYDNIQEIYCITTYFDILITMLFTSTVFFAWLSLSACRSVIQCFAVFLILSWGSHKSLLYILKSWFPLLQPNDLKKYLTRH